MSDAPNDSPKGEFFLVPCRNCGTSTSRFPVPRLTIFITQRRDYLVVCGGCGATGPFRKNCVDAGKAWNKEQRGGGSDEACDGRASWWARHGEKVESPAVGEESKEEARKILMPCNACAAKTDCLAILRWASNTRTASERVGLRAGGPWHVVCARCGTEGPIRTTPMNAVRAWNAKQRALALPAVPEPKAEARDGETRINGAYYSMKPAERGNAPGDVDDGQGFLVERAANEAVKDPDDGAKSGMYHVDIT